jgi:hypothetical protein
MDMASFGRVLAPNFLLLMQEEGRVQVTKPIQNRNLNSKMRKSRHQQAGEKQTLTISLAGPQMNCPSVMK